MPMKATSYGADYYAEHARLGMDYASYGQWQADYGKWLVGALEWSGKEILDIGCACGSITHGLCEAGACCSGVDCNECTIRLGRENWPHFARRLHIGDAANLHFFTDGTFEGFHASQTAEHWRPRLVPVILAELLRVAKPGALFFAAMPNMALPDSALHDDPTHVSLYPLDWWHEKLDAEGWDVVTDEYAEALRRDPANFLDRYAAEWQIFVAKAR